MHMIVSRNVLRKVCYRDSLSLNACCRLYELTSRRVVFIMLYVRVLFFYDYILILLRLRLVPLRLCHCGALSGVVMVLLALLCSFLFEN